MDFKVAVIFCIAFFCLGLAIGLLLARLLV
jgi:hypothetical protein